MVKYYEITTQDSNGNIMQSMGLKQLTAQVDNLAHSAGFSVTEPTIGQTYKGYKVLEIITQKYPDNENVVMYIVEL